MWVIVEFALLCMVPTAALYAARAGWSASSPTFIASPG
jgi:hypothetical protein